MLYKRSSFLKWLKEKFDCEYSPIGDSNILQIRNGGVTSYMRVDSNDIIDYEEIHRQCDKLYIPDLPGDKDLKKAGGIF